MVDGAHVRDELAVGHLEGLGGPVRESVPVIA